MLLWAAQQNLMLFNSLFEMRTIGLFRVSMLYMLYTLLNCTSQLSLCWVHNSQEEMFKLLMVSVQWSAGSKAETWQNSMVGQNFSAYGDQEV